MNRPTLFRRIYAELRDGLGPDVPSAEVARLAKSVAEAYEAIKKPRKKRVTQHTGSIPFERWALDTAMKDGGWRILEYEVERGSIVFEDVQPHFSRHQFNTWMWEHAA